MDPVRMLCESQGFLSRPQVLAAGLTDRDIAASIRAGLWTRVRRGFYTYVDLWSALDEIGRYLLTCRCVLHSLGDAVALSHVSGALLHGLTVWDVPLSHVHVTRLDGGAGRIEAGVVHHEGFSLDEDVVEVEGVRVLAPERCALEAGARVDNEHALVVLDSLLHLGLADHDALMRRFELMNVWPHMRHLHIPVRMATGKSASAGESRGRWLFFSLGIPAPICQFEVFDGAGQLRGTCDWGWPDFRQLGESDGRIKYGRLVRPGLTAGDVVFAEKLREDELRELTGYSMFRLSWGDYARPRVTARRLLPRFGRAG